jgi:hypothetical protein
MFRYIDTWIFWRDVFIGAFACLFLFLLSGAILIGVALFMPMVSTLQMIILAMILLTLICFIMGFREANLR